MEAPDQVGAARPETGACHELVTSVPDLLRLRDGGIPQPNALYYNSNTDQDTEQTHLCVQH